MRRQPLPLAYGIKRKSAMFSDNFAVHHNITAGHRFFQAEGVYASRSVRNYYRSRSIFHSSLLLRPFGIRNVRQQRETPALSFLPEEKLCGSMNPASSPIMRMTGLSVRLCLATQHDDECCHPFERAHNAPVAMKSAPSLRLFLIISSHLIFRLQITHGFGVLPCMYSSIKLSMTCAPNSLRKNRAHNGENRVSRQLSVHR